MIEKSKLARIHVLKKEAGLSDEQYKDLLAGAAGVSSSRYLETVDQYYSVVRGIQNFMIATGQSPKKCELHPNDFVDAVRRRAKKVLGQQGEIRINGFVKRIGRGSLEECDNRELRRVMGFLSTIERENAEGKK